MKISVESTSSVQSDRWFPSAYMFKRGERIESDFSQSQGGYVQRFGALRMHDLAENRGCVGVCSVY